MLSLSQQESQRPVTDQEQSELDELLGLIALIDVAELVEASRRKPVGIYGNLTFYGADDEWLFLAYHTDNTCDNCASMDEDTYGGYELRQLFKWHIIVDENTIYARVHPHCGCTLTRVTFVDDGTSDYLVYKLPRGFKRND